MRKTKLHEISSWPGPLVAGRQQSRGDTPMEGHGCEQGLSVVRGRWRPWGRWEPVGQVGATQVGGKMGRQMGPPSALPLPSQGRRARWAHTADQPLRALSELSQCSQDPRPGHGRKLIYVTRERPQISSVTGGFTPTKILGTPRETQQEIKPSPGVLRGPRQRRSQSCGLSSLKQPS